MPAIARLEARISPEIHALIKRAADLENRTITDFVVAAAQNAAAQTMAQQDIIRLSLKDQERFVEALLNPQPPNAAMERAKLRHQQLIQPT